VPVIAVRWWGAGEGSGEGGCDLSHLNAHPHLGARFATLFLIIRLVFMPIYARLDSRAKALCSRPVFVRLSVRLSTCEHDIFEQVR